MPLLVMKFGGTSVATPDRIRRAAKRVGVEVAKGHDVIVIVSAMAGKTNELVGLRRRDLAALRRARIRRGGQFGRERHGRAHGPDLAGNGRARAQLAGLAGAGDDHQRPFRRPDRGDPPDAIAAKFAEGMRVAVIAGFRASAPRAASPRWGAAAPTPRRWPSPPPSTRPLRHLHRRRRRLHHRPAHRRQGASSTASPSRKCWSWPASARRCCRPARSNWRCATTSSCACSAASRNSRTTAGTLVCAEEEIMESNVVNGIAYSRDEAKMTLVSVADRPGIAARSSARFPRRGERGHDHPEHLRGGAHRHDLLLPRDRPGARAERRSTGPRTRGEINFHDLVADTAVAKVSAVGIGMRSQSGVAARMFQTLKRRGHQHQGHCNLRDKDFRPDRPEIHGTRGSGPA